MGRPLYESSADRECEDLVAATISHHTSERIVRLPNRHHLDRCVIGERDRVLGLLEIKCRRYTMSDLHNMGGFFISLAKWNEARNLNVSASLPFALYVACLDGLYRYVVIDFGRHSGIAWKGREDRGDAQDKEMVVLLRRGFFTLLPWALPVLFPPTSTAPSAAGAARQLRQP